MRIMIVNNITAIPKSPPGIKLYSAISALNIGCTTIKSNRLTYYHLPRRVYLLYVVYHFLTEVRILLHTGFGNLTLELGTNFVKW